MNTVKNGILAVLVSSFLLSGCSETGTVRESGVTEGSTDSTVSVGSSVSTEALQSTVHEETDFDPYDFDIYLCCEDSEGPTDLNYVWLHSNEFTADTKCKEMEIMSDRVDLTSLPVNENITYLRINALNGNTLAGIDNFPNLEVLFLNDINVTDISDIYKCPKIKNLTLRFVDSVEDFSVVKKLPDLEVFYAMLSEPEATLPNIESLASCKNLTKLTLQDYDIGSIDFIGELTDLRELRLWSSDGMIDDISPLSSLTNLEKLEITQLYSDNIEPYLALKNLTYLDIEENEFSEESKNKLYEAFTDGVVKINHVNIITEETSSAAETLQGTNVAFDEIAASISIDGQDYSLPCKVKDLNSKYTIKDGKYYDDDECTYFSVFSGDEALFAIWVKGDHSTEDAPEPDAVISRILISRDTSENVSFNIIGITEGSTNKDIPEILGTPNDTYTDSSYRYVYENNICFFAFNDDDSIKFVSIITDAENYSTEESQNS